MSAPHDRPDGEGPCRGEAAVYLLGLLDEHQSAKFLEHAHSCALCGDDLTALGPAVESLPGTVAQLAAPEHTKRQVMAVVRSEASRMAGSSVSSLRATPRDAPIAWEAAVGRGSCAGWCGSARGQRGARRSVNSVRGSSDAGAARCRGPRGNRRRGAAWGKRDASPERRAHVAGALQDARALFGARVRGVGGAPRELGAAANHQPLHPDERRRCHRGGAALGAPAR